MTGVSAAVTYAWSNSAVTKDISGLSAGNYTVLIKDGNCATTATAALNKLNTNLATDICPGDSYTLTIANNTLTNIK
jgi:hypothetical protein